MKKMLALLIVLFAFPSCLYAEAPIMMATADDAPLSKLDAPGFMTRSSVKLFVALALTCRLSTSQPREPLSMQMKVLKMVFM